MYIVTHHGGHVRVNDYDGAMPRPAFTPDTEQRRTVRALEKLAARMAADDASLIALIGQAKDQDIPIEHIARAARVTTKTVYRRLGHRMR
jgi:hypothetical protein